MVLISWDFSSQFYTMPNVNLLVVRSEATKRGRGLFRQHHKNLSLASQEKDKNPELA